MRTGKRLLILCIVSVACVVCDQSTKILSAIHLPRDVMHSYFYDILRMGYTENRGGLLGVGNTLPDELRFWIFTVAVGVVLVGLLYYLMADPEQDAHSLTGLALVFSGGSCNLFDRVVNDGSVVDFLNIGWGPIRTGVFNVADMAIFTGIAIVIYTQSKYKSSEQTASRSTLDIPGYRVPYRRHGMPEASGAQ